ncbi:hypothetical protein KR018_003702, partial [Drosophila ironensis]
WYRGLSESQITAVNSMADSLQDDMDQRTVDRVRKLLDRMGLAPAPSCRTLHSLMQWSRGNDLAFLWFLMELCYKSPNHGRSYNVNEQIIMSSIFWLDLFPTLRELDRWLPLPHPSLADRDREAARQRRRQKLKEEALRERQKELEKKAKAFTPLAPYFEEPFRIRPRHHNNLLSDHVDRPALFYEIPDEDDMSPLWNRWFGGYSLSEAHRVARSIVVDEINSIFESFKAASLPPSDVECLCAHHRYIRDMEKSLKEQLEELKRKKCEEFVIAKTRVEERKRKRVVEELEHMSACYLKRFQEMAARTRLASTRKQLFGGGDVQGYTFGCPKVNKCDEWVEEKCRPPEKEKKDVKIEPEPVPIKTSTKKKRKRGASRAKSKKRLKGGAESKTKQNNRSRSRSRSKSRSRSRSKSRSKSPAIVKAAEQLPEPTPPPPPPREFTNEFEDIMVKLLAGEKPVLPECPDFRPEVADCAKVHTYNPDVGLPFETRRILKQRPSTLMQFLTHCGRKHTENEQKDSEEETASIRSAHKRKLFEYGAAGATTGKFNYRELFGSLQTTRLDDERMRLKEAFVRAIDDDVQYLSAALCGEEEGSIDAMVDRAAKRVFADDVQTFHKELQRLQRKKAAEAEEAEKMGKVPRLDFGQEFYDPEDMQLMKDMLRLGLEKVAEDKRYVLPTLPDVQTVPYLIEWVRFRYGKRYSQKQREQSYIEDKHTLERVVKFMRSDLVKPPARLRPNEYAQNPHKEETRARCHKDHQTKRFLASIMEIGRVFYSAMRPHLCTPLTNSTFYAYMPAHHHDIGFSINRRH